jgi:hypothetical protein
VLPTMAPMRGLWVATSVLGGMINCIQHVRGKAQARNTYV